MITDYECLAYCKILLDLSKLMLKNKMFVEVCYNINTVVDALNILGEKYEN